MYKMVAIRISCQIQSKQQINWLSLILGMKG